MTDRSLDSASALASTSTSTSASTSNAVLSFWFLGLLNNTPWVLMLACATDISSGGVALVFMSNIIPGLMVKISAPYWFHLISYETRIFATSVAMGLACFLVGTGGLMRVGSSGGGGLGLGMQLFGVSFMSLACSLGEASLLALAGKFDSSILPSIAPPDSYRVIYEVSMENTERVHRPHDTDENMTELGGNDIAVRLMKHGGSVTRSKSCITAFSSGTGLAGIVGYAYKSLFSGLLRLGLSPTVWSAVSLPLVYSLIYRKCLHGMHDDVTERWAQPVEENGPSDVLGSLSFANDCAIHDRRGRGYHGGEISGSALLEMTNTDNSHISTTARDSSNPSPHAFTASDRLRLVLSLWPYTIPLFTVYAAEYTLQAGVWSAIGFPVTSAAARAEFYHYSNWTYQAGVFVSRSSGMLWTASLPILWLMPFLQVVNLCFFWMDSLHRFWYDYTLLLPCFFAGLLGGSVYVQGFSRVNTDMPMELKEFAVASVGVADTLGILVADILSLFLQSCIYDKHGIDGAVVDCPVNM